MEDRDQRHHGALARSLTPAARHSAERFGDPFAEVARLDGVLGVVALVAAPGDPAAIDAASLAVLHPEERLLARVLRGWVLHDFVAGRRAARLLLGEAGPVTRAGGGAPRFPTGWRGSIAHKHHLAGAVVALEGAATLGLDLERDDAPTAAIERRVLSACERRRCGGDPIATIATFAVKEAIYKALWPHVRRFVGFAEAEVVVPELQAVGPTAVEVSLRLTQREGPFEVAAQAERCCGHVVATVAIEGRNGRDRGGLRD